MAQEQSQIEQLMESINDNFSIIKPFDIEKYKERNTKEKDTTK